MPIPPALQQDLSRRRLVPRSARAQGGSGERPGRAKGSGSEFADHRPYLPGDDIRALDARATLRTGAPVVREYVLSQRLPVTVLLDAGARMTLGTPAKDALARDVAAALTVVALAGGDAVQLGVLTGDLAVRARAQGSGRVTELLGWLGARAAGGAGSLRDAVRSVVARQPRGALLVLVSDFLSEDAPAALDAAHARAQEVLAVQVLAPQERDPARLAAPRSGAVRFRDVDGHGEATVTLDAGTLRAYRAALHAWNEDLRSRVFRHGGRWVQASSDEEIGTVVRRELLTGGVIR